MFAARDNDTEERIDEVVQLNKAARGELPLIDGYYGNFKSMYVPEMPRSTTHTRRARRTSPRGSRCW